MWSSVRSSEYYRRLDLFQVPNPSLKRIKVPKPSLDAVSMSSLLETCRIWAPRCKFGVSRYWCALIRGRVVKGSESRSSNTCRKPIETSSWKVLKLDPVKAADNGDYTEFYKTTSTLTINHIHEQWLTQYKLSLQPLRKMISVLESLDDVVIFSDQVLGVGCNRKSCKVRYIGEGSLQDWVGACRHPVGGGNGAVMCSCWTKY